MKRILVTGSSGVLGHALQAIQGEYPHCEFIFSNPRLCDLTNAVEVFDHVKECRPDAIIHLAARSGGIGLTAKYPATVLRENVLMNTFILEAARVFRVKKIAMTLSSAIYSPQAPLPFRETSIHQGPPHESNYSYAFAKRLIEPFIRAYRKEYGLPVIGLVPNGIFGENDHFQEDSCTFIAALIRRFFENRDNDLKIVVWGDGSSLRELTYSKDMARAFMWCLFHYDSPEILNVGTNEEHSIKEIAYRIAEEFGIDRKRIVFDTTKPSGIFRKSTDQSKFNQLTSFPFTPFSIGLRNTIDWFLKNYETPQKVRL